MSPVRALVADNESDGLFGGRCVICDKCGRLLNRATGRCICEDYKGEAPPPVATTHPPPPEAVQPLSKASVMSMLDTGTKSPRPPPIDASPKPAPAPPVPAVPAPPPRTPGEALGVLRSVRLGRRSVDVVVYETSMVLARRGAPRNLTVGQLAAQDSSARVIEERAVVDVAIREDRISSQVTAELRDGEVLSFAWPGYKNRGLSAENLLAGVFSGKVDQAPSAIPQRTVKAMATLGVLILLGVGASIGVARLLEEGPPPPPPPAPTTTLPPAEQAARQELQGVCASWASFASGIRSGDRPDPAALRPVVDGLKPRFDAAAAAVVDYEAARNEVVYLQEYARRPPDAIARESSSRVGFAFTTISSACTRAGSPPPP